MLQAEVVVLRAAELALSRDYEMCRQQMVRAGGGAGPGRGRKLRPRPGIKLPLEQLCSAGEGCQGGLPLASPLL